MEAKEIIIEKFYEEHLKPSVIAKELGVNPSYVTKIIKKDLRYIEEKEYRAQISKENHKIAKREWIRNHVYLILKLTHAIQKAIPSRIPL